MSNLPNFKAYCADACVKLWGEPDRRTSKEWRWGNDSYSYKSFDLLKRCWYDASAKCGGSTLELAQLARGRPVEPLRGAEFFTAWQFAYDQHWLPVAPPEKKANGRDGKQLSTRATYPYDDEKGELLFEVVRFDTTNPAHRFRQRQPDGKGGWMWNLKGVRRVLYRLPQLIAAVKAGERVIVCEGEKDAHTAVKLGYAATTMPGGVEKWRSEYDAFFHNADVVICSDNDPQLKDPKTGKPQFHADGRPKLPGQDHAARVAKRLAKVAARARIIMFKQKDLTDWVEAGGTREQLDALVEQAPEYKIPHADEKSDNRPDSGPSNQKGYMRGSTDLVCNVGNVMFALETEPELINAFAHDEMMRTEVLLRPLFSEKPDFKQRPITDADVTAVQAWLQRSGFLNLGKDVTHDAVNKHAREHAFHPLRDYLNGLRWDRTERVGTWLHKYLGGKKNKYTSEIGTMFLIGMVARILEPGCKLDYMLILEGGQGEYKSKACETLAGPEYFTDQLPDITSKECSQHLRGKWLVEVAELRAYSRAAIDHFKEFVVRQVERYRPPWGRKEVHEPRQCAFIGTTNKAHYFRDETGNRRYWPVTTGDIKLDDLRRDRDQLFAEAVELYRAGVPWWPDREFEQAHIVPEQESRYEPDIWELLVKDYLDTLHLPKKTTILQIAIAVLGYETEPPLIRKEGPQPLRKTPINRFTIKDQGRVAGILEHLGWEPKRSKAERWWEPGPKALTR
jgi:predicted P-loop ATPase